MYLICICFLVLHLYVVAQDQHKNCAFWAKSGECEANPGYMLKNCKTSCDLVESEAKATNQGLPESFYDITETDLNGNQIDFAQFKGKVVYVVNVASQCGYTQSNYALFRKLKTYMQSGLEIVIAPCNAFGAQEPGSHCTT